MVVVVCVVKGVLKEFEEFEVCWSFGGNINVSCSGIYVVCYCCSVPRIISELLQQLGARGFTHLE